MAHYLSDEELTRTAPAEVASFPSPIPTQIVSNGEFNPLPQTREQARVEARIVELADDLGPHHGMGRRQFLASSAGMAAAFLAMNEVFGPLFDVSRAEAQTPGAADQRAGALSGQFIIDAQTHFVRDDFKHEGLLGLAKYAKQNWNTALWGDNTLVRYKFENYVKEIFVDSDTKVALLSGAPFDDQTWELLTNDQIAMARASINKISGSRRLLGHSVFTPKRAGWMDEVDRCIAAIRPDSWKGYTIGDPLFPSKQQSYWRLDDQKLMYPFYEKAVKAGIATVCIHKGLLPADYEKSWPGVWEYNTVWDVGQAAKDWPQINFVMYHAALRPFLEKPDVALAEFNQTGRIKWATDLAEIPAKYGVTNVYGELGTAFANSAVADPRFAAAFVGTLVRGLGADHVIWGTDSLWYGSPQWQIEAMRRLEIPAEMQRAHRFAPLGPADGLVKTAIFSGNSARLYRLDTRAAQGTITGDKVAAIKAEYVALGGMRSNARYGYVHRGPGGQGQAATSST
jgi:predicted TIM-barrel fold metal-dependent hydrolase